MSQTYFISGIDTDIGKTFATGYLAQQILKTGRSVITQKLVQTGNKNISEDIMMHRKIMEIELTAVDRNGLTMPQIFSYPASPHLAAKIDNRPLDLTAITTATEQLEQQFEIVLLEGAGGLMVPLTETLLTIDYIQQQQLAVILVSNGRLGSINHTLLALEALKNRQIPLYALAYNHFDADHNEIIANDSLAFFKNYLATHFVTSKLIEIPVIKI